MTLGTRWGAIALAVVLIPLSGAALVQDGTDLGTLGGNAAGPKTINVWGAVTGASQTALGRYRAFLISAPGETMVPVGPDDSHGTGLNDLFDLVFATGRAWLQRGATIVDLGTGHPSDVNNLGQVAGCTRYTPLEIHAVVWDAAGGHRDLGVPGQQSFASAINDRGQVAGWINDANGVALAVRWEPDGSVTQLRTLGGGYSQAQAINEAGDVVGSQRLPRTPRMPSCAPTTSAP